MKRRELATSAVIVFEPLSLAQMGEMCVCGHARVDHHNQGRGRCASCELRGHSCLHPLLVEGRACSYCFHPAHEYDACFVALGDGTPCECGP